jgi:hypothetical protein
MMTQHAQLVAFLSLGLFGAVGLLVALLWRSRRFRIPPLALAVGVIIWILGLLLVFWQIRELHAAAVIQQWPTVEGTVLQARVIGVRAFRPNITYVYTVSGVTYRDSTDLDQPGFGGRNNKENAAETIIAAYPTGSRVIVHYNPANPGVSVLRTSPDWSTFGKIGLGGFLFGLGLFLAASFMVGRSSAPA